MPNRTAIRGDPANCLCDSFCDWVHYTNSTVCDALDSSPMHRAAHGLLVKPHAQLTSFADPIDHEQS